MKKYLTIVAAALVCLCACDKDKDIYSVPDENGNELTSEARFWNVVGNLVSMNDITSKYKGKTFTPIIGTEAEPGVRVVGVNTLEAAVERYNSMVGASIDTLTVTHTFKDSEVGTLTWNKGDGKTAWATVDVSIPAVPTLSKIIYRSAEQGNVNGSVGDGGSAYYRFGDVIKRTRTDGITEYWVCVRPAFDPEDKGKSHWISVSPLPDANIWPYYDEDKEHPFVASNEFSYSLPYSIKEGAEWMQDLAEMLYAIFYPDRWKQNITQYSYENMFGSPKGLPIFNDFHSSLVKYHNEAFWSNVQNAWKNKSIVQKVFGISHQAMADALESEGGIHFLYKGYSWLTKMSNKPQLWEARYTNKGTKDKEKNMHTYIPTKPCAQAVTPRSTVQSNTNYPFDIKTEVTVAKPYVVKPQFFGDDAPRWIIRFAEGEELVAEGGSWNAQLPIAGFDPEIGGEVYRYYRDVFKKNLTQAPEESDLIRGVVDDPTKWNKSEFKGQGHYQLGDVFRDDYGHNWFVIGVAGGNNEGFSHSPYCEIISVDGIQAMEPGHAVATNIPDKNKVLRAAQLLSFLGRQSHKYPDGLIQNIYQSVLNYAGVDLKKLVQGLLINRPSGQPGGAETFSIAYYDAAANEQRIARYMVEMGPYPENDFYTSIWTRYPSSRQTAPDSYRKLGPNDFTQAYITIQDLQRAEVIQSQADELFAKAPLWENQAVARNARTATDPNANDVRNYFYQAWRNGSNQIGMWNEPIVFLRYNVLYDRGGEYSLVTPEGLRLTLVNHVELDPLMLEMWYGNSLAYEIPEFRKVDGVGSAPPTWQSVWAQ